MLLRRRPAVAAAALAIVLAVSLTAGEAFGSGAAGASTVRAAHTSTAHTTRATKKKAKPKKKAKAKAKKKTTPKKKTTSPKVTVEPGLTLGFSFANQLTTGNPSADAVWAARAQAVGTQIIRLPVSWASIAPATPPASFDASDPNSAGYNWTTVDEQIRELSADGFKILVTVGTAPTWAEGPNMPKSAPAGAWDPSASDYAAFATAIATRYDGSFPDPLNPGGDLPRVSDWQAWNEPNLSIYLSPQWEATSSGGYEETSPYMYRDLLNAFYGAVKAVSSSNYVLAAGTAPYGDPIGSEPMAYARTPPVTFDQDLFCLNSSNSPVQCSNPAHLDAIDSHPYGVGGPAWHAPNAGDVAVPDIYKLVNVLNAAERAHTILPAGSKGNWVTEMSWNTDPPNVLAGNPGVPLAEDAQWIEQAFYVLWSQGVRTITDYQLADSPESPLGWGSTYTSGVYFVNGAAKQYVAQAYSFPFITYRKNKSTIVAWGRTPKAGTFYIEEQSGRRWRTLAKFRVKATEVFEVPLAVRGAAAVRAQVGGQTSLTWPQGG